MQKNYEEEFKKKIIRLHIEEGRTIKSLSLEYSISKSAVSYWLKKFRNECRINKKANEEQDFMKQNNKLNIIKIVVIIDIKANIVNNNFVIFSTIYILFLLNIILLFIFFLYDKYIEISVYLSYISSL